MDQEYIDVSLHEIRDRLEKIEKRLDSFDKLNDEICIRVDGAIEIAKKQHEWNKVASENFASIKEYIDLVTGGNKE